MLSLNKIYDYRYRRRHCEKQIQILQKNILDVQQELAVAHSTEKKKDGMIAQLDKVFYEHLRAKAFCTYYTKCCGDEQFHCIIVGVGFMSPQGTDQKVHE